MIKGFKMISFEALFLKIGMYLMKKRKLSGEARGLLIVEGPIYAKRN